MAIISDHEAIESIFLGNKGVVKCIDPCGEAAEFVVTCEHILAFSTGAPRQPPMGFDPQPGIMFQSDSPYTKANTCTNTIYLPISTGLQSDESGLKRFMYY